MFTVHYHMAYSRNQIDNKAIGTFWQDLYWKKCSICNILTHNNLIYAYTFADIDNFLYDVDSYTKITYLCKKCLHMNRCAYCLNIICGETKPLYKFIGPTHGHKFDKFPIMLSINYKIKYAIINFHKSCYILSKGINIHDLNSKIDCCSFCNQGGIVLEEYYDDILEENIVRCVNCIEQHNCYMCKTIIDKPINDNYLWSNDEYQ